MSLSYRSLSSPSFPSHCRILSHRPVPSTSLTLGERHSGIHHCPRQTHAAGWSPHTPPPNTPHPSQVLAQELPKRLTAWQPSRRPVWAAAATPCLHPDNHMAADGPIRRMASRAPWQQLMSCHQPQERCDLLMAPFPPRPGFPSSSSPSPSQTFFCFLYWVLHRPICAATKWWYSDPILGSTFSLFIIYSVRCEEELAFSKFHSRISVLASY